MFLYKKDVNSALVSLNNNIYYGLKKNYIIIDNLKLFYFFEKKDDILDEELSEDSDETQNIHFSEEYFFRKEYWSLFLRLESLFGIIPRIKSSKYKVKNKKKQLGSYLKLNFFLNIKNFFLIKHFLSYLFDLHLYLFFKFFLNKKINQTFGQELATNPFIKNFSVKNFSINFTVNLYFRWLDISRTFINYHKMSKKYKYKNNANLINSSKELNFYSVSLNINSKFFIFFASFIFLLTLNYVKLFLYIYKKFRKIIIEI